MILYLDTSALLKLYLREEGTDVVKALVQRATMVATSLVTYAESRAALARARSSGRLDAGMYRIVLGAFQREWESYVAEDISEPLIRLAGDLAEKHLLRGFDGIHLASAVTLQQESDEPISFSAWDERLTAAAAAEGLALAA